MPNKLFILLTFLIASLPLAAQTTVQVVTKTVHKTFPYFPGLEISIEGEKAIVEVHTWDKDLVEVILKLVAKHPDKQIAEQDLRFLDYSVSKTGNMLRLSNRISKVDNAKPRAVIETEYHINLPAECPVYVKNNFGKINIRDLMSSLQISSEFSKIFLNNLQGEIDINTFFGDIQGNHIDGNLHIESRRSDITLLDVGGHLDINASFALIKIFAAEDLLSANIEAKNSDVQFQHPSYASLKYNLSSNHGNIHVPDNMALEYLNNSDRFKKALYRQELAGVTVRISVSYGNVRIGR